VADLIGRRRTAALNKKLDPRPHYTKYSDNLFVAVAPFTFRLRRSAFFVAPCIVEPC